MTILRMVYFFRSICIIFFFICNIDKLFLLGVTSDAALDVFITPFIIYCSFKIVIPSLRKSFASWFLLDKKEIHQAVCIFLF